MNRCLRIAAASLEERGKKERKQKIYFSYERRSISIRLPIGFGVNRQEDLETYACTHVARVHACNVYKFSNIYPILFRTVNCVAVKALFRNENYEAVLRVTQKVRTEH